MSMRTINTSMRTFLFMAVRRHSGGESGFSYVNVDPYPFALRGMFKTRIGQNHIIEIAEAGISR